MLTNPSHPTHIHILSVHLYLNLATILIFIPWICNCFLRAFIWLLSACILAPLVVFTHEISIRSPLYIHILWANTWSDVFIHMAVRSRCTLSDACWRQRRIATTATIQVHFLVWPYGNCSSSNVAFFFFWTESLEEMEIVFLENASTPDVHALMCFVLDISLCLRACPQACMCVHAC